MKTLAVTDAECSQARVRGRIPVLACLFLSFGIGTVSMASEEIQCIDSLLTESTLGELSGITGFNPTAVGLALSKSRLPTTTVANLALLETHLKNQSVIPWQYASVSAAHANLVRVHDTFVMLSEPKYRRDYDGTFFVDEAIINLLETLEIEPSPILSQAARALGENPMLQLDPQTYPADLMELSREYRTKHIAPIDQFEGDKGRDAHLRALTGYPLVFSRLLWNRSLREIGIPHLMTVSRLQSYFEALRNQSRGLAFDPREIFKRLALNPILGSLPEAEVGRLIVEPLRKHIEVVGYEPELYDFIEILGRAVLSVQTQEKP